VTDGGYDTGYRNCPCYWGKEPGSLVRMLPQILDLKGAWTLDLGCGEGKNAAFLAGNGATVDAVDVSSIGLEHARATWPPFVALRWELADATVRPIPPERYDVIIAYGLLHCLPSEEAVAGTIGRMQAGTRPGGFNVVCAYNARHQELDAAHPFFRPTLLPHSWYMSAYRGWEHLVATDTDLREAHPDTAIEHTHSMTRLLARRPTT
jgi:SAM-dependent methyltransferase